MAIADWAALGMAKIDAETIAKTVISSLLPVPADASNSRLLRKYWEEALLGDGWIKGLFLEQSRLSIGYAKGDTGMCIQLGNTSRVYADLLKLETLFRQGKISQAALVVPSAAYSAALGTNYASFTRAEQDINSLKPTISVPIVLISIDNRQGE
jgi:hypothetical protein